MLALQTVLSPKPNLDSFRNLGLQTSSSTSFSSASSSAESPVKMSKKKNPALEAGAGGGEGTTTWNKGKSWGKKLGIMSLRKSREALKVASSSTTEDSDRAVFEGGEELQIRSDGGAFQQDNRPTSRPDPSATFNRQSKSNLDLPSQSTRNPNRHLSTPPPVVTSSPSIVISSRTIPSPVASPSSRTSIRERNRAANDSDQARTVPILRPRPRTTIGMSALHDEHKIRTVKHPSQSQSHTDLLDASEAPSGGKNSHSRRLSHIFSAPVLRIWEKDFIPDLPSPSLPDNRDRDSQSKRAVKGKGKARAKESELVEGSVGPTQDADASRGEGASKKKGGSSSANESSSRKRRSFIWGNHTAHSVDKAQVDAIESQEDYACETHSGKESGDVRVASDQIDSCAVVERSRSNKRKRSEKAKGKAREIPAIDDGLTEPNLRGREGWTDYRARPEVIRRGGGGGESSMDRDREDEEEADFTQFSEFPSPSSELPCPLPPPSSTSSNYPRAQDWDSPPSIYVSYGGSNPSTANATPYLTADDEDNTGRFDDVPVDDEDDDRIVSVGRVGGGEERRFMDSGDTTLVMTMTMPMAIENDGRNDKGAGGQDSTGDGPKKSRYQDEFISLTDALKYTDLSERNRQVQFPSHSAPPSPSVTRRKRPATVPGEHSSPGLVNDNAGGQDQAQPPILIGLGLNRTVSDDPGPSAGFGHAVRRRPSSVAGIPVVQVSNQGVQTRVDEVVSRDFRKNEEDVVTEEERETLMKVLQGSALERFLDADRLLAIAISSLLSIQDSEAFALGQSIGTSSRRQIHSIESISPARSRTLSSPGLNVRPQIPARQTSGPPATLVSSTTASPSSSRLRRLSTANPSVSGLLPSLPPLIAASHAPIRRSRASSPPQAPPTSPQSTSSGRWASALHAILHPSPSLPMPLSQFTDPTENHPFGDEMLEFGMTADGGVERRDGTNLVLIRSMLEAVHAKQQEMLLALSSFAAELKPDSGIGNQNPSRTRASAFKERVVFLAQALSCGYRIDALQDVMVDADGSMQQTVVLLTDRARILCDALEDVRDRARKVACERRGRARTGSAAHRDPSSLEGEDEHDILGITSSSSNRNLLGSLFGRRGASIPPPSPERPSTARRQASESRLAHSDFPNLNSTDLPSPASFPSLGNETYRKQSAHGGNFPPSSVLMCLKELSEAVAAFDVGYEEFSALVLRSHSAARDTRRLRRQERRYRRLREAAAMYGVDNGGEAEVEGDHTEQLDGETETLPSLLRDGKASLPSTNDLVIYTVNRALEEELLDRDDVEAFEPHVFLVLPRLAILFGLQHAPLPELTSDFLSTIRALSGSDSSKSPTINVFLPRACRGLDLDTIVAIRSLLPHQLNRVASMLSGKTSPPAEEGVTMSPKDEGPEPLLVIFKAIAGLSDRSSQRGKGAKVWNKIMRGALAKVGRDFTGEDKDDPEVEDLDRIVREFLGS